MTNESYDLKRQLYELKEKPPKEIRAYILNTVRNIKKNGGCSYDVIYTLEELLKKDLDYTEDEWMALFRALDDETTTDGDMVFIPNVSRIENLPILNCVKQIEYCIKKNGQSEKLSDFIVDMLSWEWLSPEYRAKNRNTHIKVIGKLHALVADKVLSQFRLEDSDFVSKEVNALIANSPLAKQSEFHELLFLAEQTASKPSAKFLKTTQSYIEKIGRDKYRRFTHKIIQIPIEYKYGVGVYAIEFYKGIIWMMLAFSDKQSAVLIGKLAELAYMRNLDPKIGNACAYTLGNMRGKMGLGELSRLKGKLTRNKDKAVVEKYLNEGAERYGVSVEELKELAVPDFHLEDGQKTIAFEDYQLTIAIENSKVTQTWTKPDGKTVKTVPAVVKNSSKLTNKLKEIRKEIKEIQQTYSAQKQRIDNQFTLNRKWTFADFEQYYLTHGLVAPIAKSLIWQFHQADGIVTALFNREANAWQDQHGETVNVAEAQSVSLWHPVLVNEEEIIAWRDRIMAIECQQPIKQAFREIYLLTDAEISTRRYSNRMATHILKQSQFKVLATLRDWHYASMGAYYDYTTHTTCSKKLSEHNMSAEFWIDAVETDDEDDRNASGMYWYVTTDQVRFNNADGETMDLIDVPKIIFSEIMRDVDLFVGVCSVGNDPEWRNNNERQDRYWLDYSFGNLSEVAKTRKAVLERLLPRLTKLKGKVHIDGKFLVVKGKLRTYKIHIGSSNILMEPNDQYLCIVPARNKANKLFLPFEDDNGLSIVLSKAFMLAEDAKIKDETIISQINRAS